jgi:hypothetical protein
MKPKQCDQVEIRADVISHDTKVDDEGMASIGTCRRGSTLVEYRFLCVECGQPVPVPKRWKP